MSEPFSSKHHRVEVQLLQVLARLFLILVGAIGRKCDAAVVEAADIRREKTAGMRPAQPESRKSIERAFKNQMRERDGCFQRIANHVGQHAVALQSVPEFRDTGWM